MSEDFQRQILKQALVEHIRWWIAGDALWSEKWKDRDQVDAFTLRQIATGYYVSRGLLEGKEGQIAQLIQCRLHDWPNTLIERAKFVQELAEQARDNRDGPLTNGLQLSAFSKLLWFLRPDGWALFDRYAQQGLARPKKALSYNAFYSRLDELQFDKVTNAMRDVIEASEFPDLWPERIIDKYLMICGQGEEDTFIDHAQSDYIRVLDQFADKTFSLKVEALTDSLLDAVCNEGLFQMHKQLNPRVINSSLKQGDTND